MKPDPRSDINHHLHIKIWPLTTAVIVTGWRTGFAHKASWASLILLRSPAPSLPTSPLPLLFPPSRNQFPARQPVVPAPARSGDLPGDPAGQLWCETRGHRSSYQGCRAVTQQLPPQAALQCISCAFFKEIKSSGHQARCRPVVPSYNVRRNHRTNQLQSEKWNKRYT